VAIVITDRSAEAVAVTVVYPRRKLPSENVDISGQLAAIGRDLWRELFTQINTLEQLATWENKIPSFECNCKRFYLSWKANNQPVEVNGEIPFEWKWALKSAVNQKLGHADLSLDEARQYWQSQLTSSDPQTQLQRCKEDES